jgi:preprotein translocase subunit SecG
MGFLSVVLLVIFAIASVLMILVIMLQDDQGEGIGGLFGGGSSSAFGSRSGNILTRFTTILGAIFIVGAFALAWLNRTPESTDIVQKARLEQIQQSEESNWWVERIPEQKPASENPATQPQAGGQTELPSGINR